MVWWLLWNSNLYYTAVPSTRVRNSQLDANTEQNADLDPEGLEPRTTLHVVWGYARRTKQTLAITIVAKVPPISHQGPTMDPSVSCWASEKKKTDHFLRWLVETYSVEPGFSNALHHCLDLRHLENSTHISSPHHTHVHNLCQLL